MPQKAERMVTHRTATQLAHHILHGTYPEIGLSDALSPVRYPNRGSFAAYTWLGDCQGHESFLISFVVKEPHLRLGLDRIKGESDMHSV